VTVKVWMKKVSVLGRRQNEIEAEAAGWVIRLGGGPLPAEERRALDRWLAENPVHAAAFDHAHSIWADLAALKAAPGALVHDVIPPGHRSSTVPHRRHRTAGTAMFRVVAVVALIVVGTSLGAFWFGDPTVMLEVDYRTMPGESRAATLADGSVVRLDTESAQAVHFDGQGSVVLSPGQAVRYDRMSGSAL
jgi:transmembrane sensor